MGLCLMDHSPMGLGPMGLGPMGQGPMGQGPMGLGPMGPTPMPESIKITPYMPQPLWGALGAHVGM